MAWEPEKLLTSMTLEERMTRLEDAVWDLELMVTDGLPGRHLSSLNTTSREAARRLLATFEGIRAERS